MEPKHPVTFFQSGAFFFPGQRDFSGFVPGARINFLLFSPNNSAASAGSRDSRIGRLVLVRPIDPTAVPFAGLFLVAELPVGQGQDEPLEGIAAVRSQFDRLLQGCDALFPCSGPVTRPTEYLPRRCGLGCEFYSVLGQLNGPLRVPERRIWAVGQEIGQEAHARRRIGVVSCRTSRARLRLIGTVVIDHFSQEQLGRLGPTSAYGRGPGTGRARRSVASSGRSERSCLRSRSRCDRRRSPYSAGGRSPRAWCRFAGKAAGSLCPRGLE